MNKERPILFSTPMVQAILAGRKTMTRRVVKPQPNYLEEINQFKSQTVLHNKNCPYKLWVRETWHKDEDDPLPYYKASEDHPEIFKWKPSIFMPRWASRITLEITNVRVERLQDMPLEDTFKEGWSGLPTEKCLSNFWFEKLWDSINGKKYPWSNNPWVWVIEFKRLER